MRSLLDVLDDDPGLAAVLEEFRAGRGGIEENMGTVKALMRPPGDPFHERLVASYPQIRRFLPRLIEALELEAAGPGRAVLDACQALGDWLTEQPPHHPAARRGAAAGGGHSVLAAARARCHRRPGRLRLLCARPTP